jgi:hypothetical protein
MHALLTRLACTLFDTVDPTGQHHSVNSTDTSTCYQHLVSWTDTSACYLHLVTQVVSRETEVEFYMHITIEAGLERTLLHTAAAHDLSHDRVTRSSL